MLVSFDSPPDCCTSCLVIQIPAPRALTRVGALRRRRSRSSRRMAVSVGLFGSEARSALPIVRLVWRRRDLGPDLLLRLAGIAPDHLTSVPGSLCATSIVQSESISPKIIAVAARGRDADRLAVLCHVVGIHEAALVARHFHVVVGLILANERSIDVDDIVAFHTSVRISRFGRRDFGSSALRPMKS